MKSSCELIKSWDKAQEEELRKYKDLIEEEKLIINARRADSWRYANYRLWEITVKDKI